MLQKKLCEKGNVVCVQGRGVLEQEQGDALQVVGGGVMKRRPAAPESVSNRLKIGCKSCVSLGSKGPKESAGNTNTPVRIPHALVPPYRPAVCVRSSLQQHQHLRQRPRQSVKTRSPACSRAHKIGQVVNHSPVQHGPPVSERRHYAKRRNGIKAGHMTWGAGRTNPFGRDRLRR
jgi:hypothetical protein